jgi:hypothetical protein
MFLNSIDNFDPEFYKHHRSCSNVWLVSAMNRSMSSWHEERRKYWCFTRKGYQLNWRTSPRKTLEFPKGLPNLRAPEIKDWSHA